MFVLLTDDACHWYIVPIEESDIFEHLLELDTCESYALLDEKFSQYRINGPHEVLIKDYELI